MRRQLPNENLEPQMLISRTEYGTQKATVINYKHYILNNFFLFFLLSAWETIFTNVKVLSLAADGGALRTIELYRVIRSCQHDPTHASAAYNSS